MEQGIGHVGWPLGPTSPSQRMTPSPVGYVAFPKIPRSHTGYLLPIRDGSQSSSPRHQCSILPCWLLVGTRRMSCCHCLTLIPQTGCGTFQDQLLNVSSVQVLTL